MMAAVPETSSKQTIEKASEKEEEEVRTAIPEYVEHRVEHCQQRFSWDCGVACVLMLLPLQQRREFLQNFDAICREEGFNKSTWTIDLCYLLKRFGVKHKMYSTKIGVNERFKHFSYYSHIFEQDRERVQQRFKQAARHGISVVRGNVRARSLAAHAARHGPAIVLVDGPLLACELCKHNKMKAELRRWLGGAYSGHYVLVVGAARGRLLFRDPALPARLCAATVPALDVARNAPGTDTDTILIYQNYR